MGSDLHGGNKSKVLSVTRLKICGNFVKLLKVSPYVEPGPEPGAASGRQREIQCSLFCSALGEWTSRIFHLARHLLLAVSEVLRG